MDENHIIKTIWTGCEREETPPFECTRWGYSHISISVPPIFKHFIIELDG